MHLTYRILLSLAFALWACDGGSNTRGTAQDGSRLVNVSGAVYLGDSPVAGAVVALVQDGVTAAESKTDDAGQFLIPDIAQDEYQFVAMKVAGSSLYQYSRAITADKDVTVGKVKIKPWSLTAEPTGTQSVRLAWAPFRGDGFFEYRVFRSSQPVVQDSAADNTGATFTIHMATDAEDTEYVDTDVYPGKTYYYRVMVYSVDKKLGGTNITTATTPLWPEGTPTKYRLHYSTSYALPNGGTLGGFDSDGQYLWIATIDYTAGYYTDDIVTLHQYDPVTRGTVKKFIYDNDYVAGVSLAFGGGKLWLSSAPQDNGKTKIIDPQNGLVLAEYPLSSHELGETAADATRFFISYTSIRVLSHSFSFVDQWYAPYIWGPAGMAYRTGELWLSDGPSRQFAILDDTGAFIGVTENAELLSSGGPLAFLGNQLLVQQGNLIFAYDIEELP